MLENFKGVQYRLANNWYSFLNVKDYENKPINYLEIGTFYGANLLSVSESYGRHNDSKLHCIDPWIDYDEYPEYKDKQSKIYETFIENLENYEKKEKIVVNRGYSYEEIPKFENEFFDIIYIDGNHKSDYVLEDAVLSFRKLKKNGVLIFDDYGWCNSDDPKKGIDTFLEIYKSKISYIGERESQVFVRKI